MGKNTLERRWEWGCGVVELNFLLQIKLEIVNNPIKIYLKWERKVKAKSLVDKLL